MYVNLCLCMYVLVIFFYSLGSRLANFLERNFPFGFLLVVFDCGAVALSAYIFPWVSWTEGVR